MACISPEQEERLSSGIGRGVRGEREEREKEKKAETESERKPGVSYLHYGLILVLCLKQRKIQESPRYLPQVPQNGVTLAAWGQETS